MARKPRIFYPGAIYHVMLRGNHGEQIFFSNKDRAYFYSLLDEGVGRFQHRIHAFCLMDNHVHLAIQVGNISLSKIIQNVAFRYARWINKQNKHVGHLFQGRHRAILIDKDSYLLNVIRYIHLNPVKANICLNPDLYPWCSHNAYLGKDNIQWLTTDWILGFFSQTKQEAQAKYVAYLKEGLENLDDVKLPATHSKYEVLGDDAFLEKLIPPLSAPKIKISLSELIECVCNFYSIEQEMLISASRKRLYSKARVIICMLAKEYDVTPTTVIARHFNRDPSRFIRLAHSRQNRIYYDDVLLIKDILMNKSLSHA